MSTSQHHDAALGAIVTTYRGTTNLPELLATMQTALTLATERNCWHFFTDCTELKGGESLFDLYQAAGEVVAKRPPRQLKEAVLMAENSGEEEKFRFWEDVCQNRGLNSRIFTDRAVALAWLAK